MKKPQILVNAVMATDGTIIRSMHRHDFKAHTTQEGQNCFVDGGLEYTRYGGKCTPITLTTESDFSLLRVFVIWASYGKDGKGGLTYTPMFLIGGSHLLNTIEHLEDREPDHRLLPIFRKELEYRKENNIFTIK